MKGRAKNNSEPLVHILENRQLRPTKKLAVLCAQRREQMRVLCAICVFVAVLTGLSAATAEGNVRVTRLSHEYYSDEKEQKDCGVAVIAVEPQTSPGDSDMEGTVCEPTLDGRGCAKTTCTEPSMRCLPKAVEHHIASPLFPHGGVDDLGPVSGTIEIEGILGKETLTIGQEWPTVMRIAREDPVQVGSRRLINTKVLEMAFVAVGMSSQIPINGSPTRESTGRIEGCSSPGSDFPAEGSFDLFLIATISIIPGSGAINCWHEQPIPLVSGGIDSVPLSGAVFETPPEWEGVELIGRLFGQDIGIGQSIRHIVLELGPVRTEWEVVECECMDERQNRVFMMNAECLNCADLNRDGVVNLKDLAIVTDQWLDNCW